MTAALPFDAAGSDQVAEALRLCDTETLGRELARRARQALEAAESARDVSQASQDLVALANAAETAHQAAAWVGRFATAVCALIGSGDVVLVRSAFAQSRKATGYAATARARWDLARQKRGQVNA